MPLRNTELMKERMKELMKELNDNDDIFSRNKLLLTNKESLTGAATILYSRTTLRKKELMKVAMKELMKVLYGNGNILTSLVGRNCCRQTKIA